MGDTRHFWAAPFEREGEYGGHGSPAHAPGEAIDPLFKSRPGENTTLVIVATDARMDRLMLKQFAIMAHTGLGRAIYPAHTPLDGDIVFAVSTGMSDEPDPVRELATLGAHGANVTARAIARAVYDATGFAEEPKRLPAYNERFAEAAT